MKYNITRKEITFHGIKGLKFVSKVSFSKILLHVRREFKKKEKEFKKKGDGFLKTRLESEVVNRFTLVSG